MEDKHPVGWHNIPVLQGSSPQLHCVPVNDIRPHKLAEDCPCTPTEDVVAPGYYMHYSWDGRERYFERGRKMH